MGGAEAVVSEICRHLSSAGFRIFVITAVPLMDCQGDTTPWFRDVSRGVYHLPASLPSDKWEEFVNHLIRRERIELLWVVGSSFIYEQLPGLKERFPRLAVVDLLFNPVGHTQNHLKYSAQIDHATVEQESMKQWLMDHGRCPASISVIPNGVDRKIYKPMPKRAWRIGARRFTLGFFGRFSEEKGPDVFVELAAKLKSRADIDFIMCGVGVMEPVLRERIKAEGLEDRVYLLGMVRTPEYLPCCDAIVVPSRLDGRPNIVLESVSMGVPVIAARTGGIPEMAPDESGVAFFDPGNLDSLECVARRLLDEPGRRRELSERGIEYAAAHFSSFDSGAAYRELFLKLVRAKRGVPNKTLLRRLISYARG